MVGLQTLDLAIGVRVPASQPLFLLTPITQAQYASANLEIADRHADRRSRDRP